MPQDPAILHYPALVNNYFLSYAALALMPWHQQLEQVERFCPGNPRTGTPSSVRSLTAHWTGNLEKPKDYTPNMSRFKLKNNNLSFVTQNYTVSCA